VLLFEAVDGGVLCYVNQPDIPAGCDATAPPDGDVIVRIFVARYPPAFYGIAGLPMLLESLGVSDGRVLLILSRLTAAVLSTVLLAAAMATAGPLIGARRSYVVGIVSVLPMGIYFASAINPQAIEIFAAVALTMFVLTLRANDLNGEDTRASALGSAISFAALVSARPLSLLPASVLAIALGLTFARPLLDAARLVRLHAGPALLAAVAALAASVWLAFVYVPAFGPNAEAMDVFEHWDYGLGERVLGAVARVDELFPEYVIVTGWLDTRLPLLVYVCWYSFITVAVAAAWRLERRFRASILVLGTAAFIGSILLMASSGLRWQGRYSLPLLCPVLVLVLWALATADDERRHARSRGDRMLGFGFGLTLVTLAIALYWSVMRFSYGLPVDAVFPTLPRPTGDPAWEPPMGLLAGAVVAVIGLAAPVVVYGWLGRIAAAARPSAPRSESPTDASDAKEPQPAP
jgi:hypothetical protein